MCNASGHIDTPIGVNCGFCFRKAVMPWLFCYADTVALFTLCILWVGNSSRFYFLFRAEEIS